MWKEKPALFAATIMAAGFAAARLAPLAPAVWAACALACCIPSAARLLRMRSASAAACFSLAIPLLLFFASALWFSISIAFESDHVTKYLRLGRPVRVTCRVADEPVMREGRTQVVVDVTSLSVPTDTTDGDVTGGDSAAVGGRALLTVIQDRGKGGYRPGYSGPGMRSAKVDAPVADADASAQRDTLNFSYGDIIAFTAVLEEPQDTRNPGEVSYRDYLAINNIYAASRVRGYHAITVIDSGGGGWLYAKCVIPARRFVARSIRTAAGGDEANYLTGLLLGDRSDISKEIRQAFADTGTVHVLAVSGSHVVVIVAAIYALFGMLRIPPRAKVLATVCAVLFYMLMTGAAPSVVRASLMASVVLGGKLFRRQASVYNCLGVSAVLMFIADPKQMFDVGFQLSFAAVSSMVFFYPRLAGWTARIPRSKLSGRIAAAAVEITAVSAAAQIGTIPFTAYYFEKVSLISLFANLFVVPLAGLNITIGFVSVLFSIVTPWIGSCFTEVNSVLAHLALVTVKTASRVPYAIVHTASFGARGTIVYALVTAMLFSAARPPAFRRLFLLLFLAADCMLVHSALAGSPRVMRVTFFDVGQGDAALVEFPGGASMMIDAGPRSEQYDAGEKVIAPGLRRRGISRLSALLVTHLHDDHAGGAASVLSGIGAERLILPSLSGSRALARPGEQRADADSVAEAHRGDVLAVHADARLYVMSAMGAAEQAGADDAYAAANNSSVVAKLCYGRIAFLLMGDAERAVEQQMADRYGGLLHSAVIKLGHHGSGTSSSEALLRAAAPEEAVISVGRFNAFRHPSPSTLRRLRHLGIAVHRTDREGAIVYETDGETLRRVAWRDDARMRGLLR